MKFTLGQIAALLGAEVVGNPAIEVFTISKIEEAQAGSITFLSNPKYTPYIYTTQASAVIVSRDFMPQGAVTAALLRTDNPYNAFTMLLEFAEKALRGFKSGIEQPCHIAPSAKIGANVYIGAFAYIGDGAVIEEGASIYPNSYVGDFAKVGKNSTLFANVSLYHHCEIGANCIIHAGTVIGSDGFGFAPQADGSYRKIPQLGNVVVEDNVEIGGNTVIDRATMGSTRIGIGVKLDNLIQIAHNVEIGKNTAVAAQAGISGSTKIGERSIIGGQAGLVGHLRIANGTKIDAQSGVVKSVEEENKAFRGSPAQPYRKQLKSEVLFMQLDVMAQQIRALEQKIASLTDNQDL